MNQRGLWQVSAWWVVPVSARWVDVFKAGGITRSQLLARDFRGADRHRDDLFVATPPLEAVRVLISRAATLTPSRKLLNMMFIDAKGLTSTGRVQKTGFCFTDFVKPPPSWSGSIPVYWSRLGFRGGSDAQYYTIMLHGP